MDRRVFLGGIAGASMARVFDARGAEERQGQWGDIHGRIVYEGKPPKPAVIELTKDAAAVKEPVYDESLQVDAATHGIANCVVRLCGTPGESAPIHPSLDQIKLHPVEMQLKGLRFVPHVCVVQTGQKFVMKSADPVGHNPRRMLRKNPEFQPLLGVAQEEKIFGWAEPAPCLIDCAIHPWESAVLVVTDHPYVGVSQTDGSFAMHNLPVGKWRLQLWHERCRWITQATIGGKAQKLEQGKLAVEIKPGRNDLGEIKVGPELFERKRD